MPPGSIRLRSGSVFYSANSCSRTISAAWMSLSRPFWTSLLTTTEPLSLSSGPTRLKSWNASLARTCGRLYLVVHPPSSGHFWQMCNPGLPARLMSPTSTPHIGMFMCVPVGRRLLHRLLDLSPGLEASAFERQRLEGFPPGFNQVQVRGVRGLKDELPARIGQIEEQDIDGPMHAQVV